MEKLKITLLYIIKTSTDACYETMARELYNELKTYNEADRKLLDDKFNNWSREQIAAWLCKNYYIESADCDCETCVYNCNQ